MKNICWHPQFKRAFKSVTANNPKLQEKIFDVLTILADNHFDPKLKTHKLHGKLNGLYSCYVEYDCRIIFSIENDNLTNENVFGLIDIGTHDEVY